MESRELHRVHRIADMEKFYRDDLFMRGKGRMLGVFKSFEELQNYKDVQDGDIAHVREITHKKHRYTTKCTTYRYFSLFNKWIKITATFIDETVLGRASKVTRWKMEK